MTPFQSVFFYRGTTVNFSSTFYDLNGVVVQPTGAAVNIWWTDLNGNEQQTLVQMAAPTSPAVAWTAQWDTRSVDPGTVSWSVHSEGNSVPYGVGDGTFDLLANNANLQTF